MTPPCVISSTATTWMTAVIISAASAAPCTICEYGPDTVPFPTKQVLPDSRAPANTCDFLQSTQGLIEEGTVFCDSIRAASTSCGCNVPPSACSICWDNSRVRENATLIELTEYRPTDYLPLAPADFVFTCESFESYWHTIDQDDPRCAAIQQEVGETCGCPPPIPTNVGSNQTTTTTNATTTVTQPPEQEQAQETIVPCTLCPLGEAAPWPQKPIELGDLHIDSCRGLEQSASFLDGSSEECVGLQAMGSYCGCALKNENYCTLCPNGEPVPYKNKKLNWLSELSDSEHSAQYLEDSLTCELMEAIVAGGDASLFGLRESMYCFVNQLKSWVCGCEPDWRVIALTWAYRSSGMLSLLGSSFIIVDVLRRRKQQRFTIYHQLMLGISCFDAVSSIAYMMVGVMAPYEAGFYLSRGNLTTCKIQAFMIQIGMTSIFYNLCLSIYFLLIISFRWRECHFERLQIWTHAFVIALGTIMAIVSLPYTGSQFGVCGLLTPPAISQEWPNNVFYTLPMAVVLVGLTVATVAVCRTVFAQQRRANKWRFDNSVAWTRKVFWQSFFYVAAFYATFPFLIFNKYARHWDINIYHYLVMAIFAPIQGFLNALVYFQRSKNKTNKKKKKSGDSGSSMSRWFVSKLCCKRKHDEFTSKTAPKSSLNDTSEAEEERRETSVTKNVTDGDENGGGDVNNEEGANHQVMENHDDTTQPHGTSGEDHEVFAAVVEHLQLNEWGDDNPPPPPPLASTSPSWSPFGRFHKTP